MIFRSSIIRRIGRATKNSLAVVGFGTSAVAAHQFGLFESLATNEDEEPKRRVLVLPFHRMKIVEQKEGLSLPPISLSGEDTDNKILKVKITDLLEMIHEAAKDPEIVAIYATFGHGFKFQCGGYAHIEEIRKAIRVFNESHRRHQEPAAGNTVDPPIQKYSYAFADTFDSPMDTSNKEYFLASAFSRIQMQPRGSMNIFGVSVTNLFFKKALENYGIKPYIFKRGSYKNAPNMWTEDGYTKEHLENTQSIVQSINNSICEAIVQSRSLSNTFNSSIWKALYDYGTMTAENALEIKLVDFLPNINPLIDLLDMAKDKEHSDKLRQKWGDKLDLDNFKGQETLSMEDFSKILKKRRSSEKRRQAMHSLLEKVTSKSSATETLLSIFGWETPLLNLNAREFRDKSSEKIAVVSIDGGIDNNTAHKVTQILRELKKDKALKCIILRINSPGGTVTASETILEECKDMPQPIVCSFANLAASGGYYIAMSSDKIFASQTTLTGSIGVFGGKMDFSGFARRNGITPQSVLSGKHGTTYSSFQPLSSDMQMNLTRNIDRMYSYFKQIVSEGRNIQLEEVEGLAGGRVWTGEQAQRIGLVDEIGGIDRAVSYAKNMYTTGNPEVEFWPKQKSFSELLSRHLDKGIQRENTLQSLVTQQQMLISGEHYRNSSSIWFTMDEQTTLDAMISGLFEND